jgi:hypothetical protein
MTPTRRKEPPSKEAVGLSTLPSPTDAAAQPLFLTTKKPSYAARLPNGQARKVMRPVLHQY